MGRGGNRIDQVGVLTMRVLEETSGMGTFEGEGRNLVQ